MKSKGIIIIFWIAALAAISALVMVLWNALMPVIFGLAVINFWQALGLFVLARILLGGFGFGRNGFHGGKYMHGMGENPLHEKWKKMTPEERKEFIERRRKFGFGGPFGRAPFDTEEYGEQGKENE